MKLPKLDGRRALTARRGWALAVVVAAVAGSAVGTVLAVQRPASSAAAPELQAQVVWPAGAKPAPNFALRDQDGKLVTLASERGRPVLVTFLDSRCKRECPVEGRTLADVQRRTAASGAVLAVVSIDPWADTPGSARKFAAEAGWRGDWHWLLGKKARLAPVWRAYNIAVKRTPGDILHSTALYLIDARGDLRAGYLFPFSPGVVAHDVRRLGGST
ncbi:MAG: SCO family protein [Actinobacteria bacterium]|nr:MAG: SCO family protein [Actinomycetota bacterium]